MRMETNTLDNSQMELEMVKEYIHIQTVMSMTENGRMILKVGLGHINGKAAINT